MGFNPSLERYPEEAALIGLMVVGYGELEFLYVFCAGLATRNEDNVLRAIHSVRSEAARIEVADILGRPGYEEHQLADKYLVALGALRWCKDVRNQYAHAQWGDFGSGLRFSDPDDAFKGTKFKAVWRDIKLDLLKTQLAYFEYTRECLLYLEQQVEYHQTRRGHQTARSWPERRQPPSRYS